MNLDLDAILARANAATDGPWAAYDLRHQRGGQIRLHGGGYRIANVMRSGDRAAEDAEFITAARTDVPELVAEVERLRGALDLARQWHDEPGQFPDGAAAVLEQIVERLGGAS